MLPGSVPPAFIDRSRSRDPVNPPHLLEFAPMHDLWEQWGPQSPQAIMLARIMLRLVIAAFLGGIIGLEREMKRKPAGRPL